MSRDFKALREIWATAPTLKRDYASVLNLSSNELSHPAHERIAERWLRTLRPSSVARYPYYPEVQARLASRLGREPSEVWLVAGADEGARILCLTLGRAYGQVIASWPNYRGYLRYCQLAAVPLRQLDLQSSAASIDGEPSLLILTDPDPVHGSRLTDVERAAWIQAARTREHLLFVDEAYVGFDGTGPFSAPWAPASLRTFSKSLGMAGLRLAALIVPAPLGDYLSRWSPSNTVSALALDFLAYALDHELELAAVAAEVARVRDVVCQRAEAELARWRVSRSLANFVCFRLPSEREASAVAAELGARRIAVKSFVHGEGDPLCLRMTVVDEDRMQAAMDLLAALHGSWAAHG